MVAPNQKHQAIVAVCLTTLLADSTFCRLLECGDTYTDTNGTITWPRHPSTNNTTLSSCRLTIDTRNQSITVPHHLQLTVTAFDVTGIMPYCSHGNHLEILLGCRFTSVGGFCGVSAFPVFYSTEGCLGLVLHGEVRHLQAEYSLRSLDEEVEHIPSGCGPSRLANITHGNIFSPRWPLPYPDFVDCVWTVRARKELHIKLIFFDFDVNVYEPCEQMDFLEVRAGGNGYTHAQTLQTKNTECGRKDPFDMIIKSDTFYITFRSERSTGARGFMAGFVAFETEAAELEPHILIMMYILIIVASIKFIISLLSSKPKPNSNYEFRKCGLQQRSCEFGYSCGCRESQIMPPNQIDDCPQLESSDAPGVPKESFLDDLPIV